MRRLRIALGCDGVLADVVSGILRVVEEVTGRRHDPAEVTELDFARALGLSAREASEVRRTIEERRGFVTALAPYPLARQGVRRLRELGEVSCVTSPWRSSPWWRAERDSWLALHFGIDVVHHAEDKSTCSADVFVDDCSEHVRAWSAAWPSRVAVLWRTPHNAAEAVPDGAHSINSWEGLHHVARRAALDPTAAARPKELQ